MDYGANIRAARKAAGLTQKQLADRLGISSVNISQLEHNQRIPNMATLQRIADALNIHIFELTGVGEALSKVHLEIEEVEPVSENSADLMPDKQAELEKILFEDPRTIYDSLTNKQKTEFWRTLMDGKGGLKFGPDSNRERINAILDQMDEAGRAKVADYAEDILPRYRRKE